MKVFIGWSGNLSKRLAESLRDWLPGVVQAVEPFFSPDDIAKGDRWGAELASTLEECRVGIFCLTRASVKADWLLFEAGAISRDLGSGKICTIFFDLAPTDITGPLTQFQGAKFEKEEIFRVVKTVNEGVEAQRLDAAVLKTVFEKWWPDLQTKVEGILAAATSPEAAGALRTDREILAEILTLVRHARSRPCDRGGFIHPDSVGAVFSTYKTLLMACVESDFSVGPAVSLGRSLEALFRHLGREHRLVMAPAAIEGYQEAEAVLLKAAASQGEEGSDKDGLHPTLFFPPYR